MDDNALRTEQLEFIFGHTYTDDSLLERALTHSSYVNEVGEGDDYERLEFLGDAVLELVVSDMLVERFPKHREGELSRMRASAVNRGTLAGITRRLGLGPHIRMSHGEDKTGGRDKETILADIFEAVIGSIYLDAGLGAAAGFIERHFDLMFEGEDSRLLFTDYKTRLQEAVQGRFGRPPAYRVVDASGPDHNKSFEVEVAIQGKVWGRGEGSSKKAAEQDAAKSATQRLAREEADKETPS